MCALPPIHVAARAPPSGNTVVRERTKWIRCQVHPNGICVQRTCLRVPCKWQRNATKYIIRVGLVILTVTPVREVAHEDFRLLHVLRYNGVCLRLQCLSICWSWDVCPRGWRLAAWRTLLDPSVPAVVAVDRNASGLSKERIMSGTT